MSGYRYKSEFLKHGKGFHYNETLTAQPVGQTGEIGNPNGQKERIMRIVDDVACPQANA